MKRYELDKYKDEIINLYVNEQLSCKKISECIGCSLCGVYDALKRWDIKSRNLVESHKIYYINENYFEYIDSEDKAYWLGFIYADGYITNNNLGISLASKDEEHIEKFLKCSKSNYPINRYISKSKYGECKYSRVIIRSLKLVNDLKNKGVLNNKSLILKFPDENKLDKLYYRHFIRGYFDGDGSLVLSHNSINFKICGTKGFLEKLIEVFNFSLQYNYQNKLFKRKNDNRNNYYISYGGRNKTLNIMNYLYEDCYIYLERKYMKYIKLKSTV